MASGLTLVFGIMRVINVAQGALVILAAYLSYALFSHLHIDPFLSILIVTPAMFLLGVAVQLVFVRSLRGPDASELSLLVTWALALGIEGVLSVVFKTTYRSTNPSTPTSSWDVVRLPVQPSSACSRSCASAVILLLLSLLLTRTRFGRSVRATVQNPTAAQPARRRREPRPDAQLRARRLDGGGCRRRLRRHLSVQPGQPLRPDLAAALDRRARRASAASAAPSSRRS